MSGILVYDRTDIGYDGVAKVRGASFSLKSGEILGIAGESGSGKSTLIRAAMGLLGPGGRVTGGDIIYRGRSLLSLSREERRRINGAGIAMIFQNSASAFCPVRTVAEQLLESAAEHFDVSKEELLKKVSDCLQRLGLNDPDRVLKSCPFELSGGIGQRVGIAAAMMMSPRVLLADEPTSALDASSQKLAVREMLSIRERSHASILIATHNIGVLRAMADRVIMMKSGRIIEEGETKSVLENPRREYTKTLIAAVPKLHK